MTAALEQRLVRVAFRREAAEVDRRIAHRDLRELVHEADKAGWTKVRIAQVAGVSRQTVHELLKEDR